MLPRRGDHINATAVAKKSPADAGLFYFPMDTLHEYCILRETVCPRNHMVRPSLTVNDASAILFFTLFIFGTKLPEAWLKSGRNRRRKKRVEIAAGELQKKFYSRLIFCKT